MLENITLGLIICLAALLIASVSDIRTREVPDWVSYSLIVFAIGYSLILSFFYQNAGFLVNSIAGLFVGFIIGLVMFYAGQWGGGDSKLIMGVFAILGVTIPTISSINDHNLAIIFLINSLIIGALYGIAYSFAIALANYSNVSAELKKRLGTKGMITARIGLLTVVFFSIAFHFMSRSLESATIMILGIAASLMFYIWVLVSSVEKVQMIREVDVSKLTEGDWIAKPVVKLGKVILHPQKTGIDLEGIRLLKQSNIKKVIVKVGIPFVPSFFISLAATIWLGNWLVFL